MIYSNRSGAHELHANTRSETYKKKSGALFATKLFRWNHKASKAFCCSSEDLDPGSQGCPHCRGGITCTQGPSRSTPRQTSSHWALPGPSRPTIGTLSPPPQAAAGTLCLRPPPPHSLSPLSPCNIAAEASRSALVYIAPASGQWAGGSVPVICMGPSRGQWGGAAARARRAMFPSGAGAGAGDTARGRAGRGDLPGARPGQRRLGLPRREDVGGGAQEAVSQSQPGKDNSSGGLSGGAALEGALLLAGISPCAHSWPPASRRSEFVDLLLSIGITPWQPGGCFLQRYLWVSSCSIASASCDDPYKGGLPVSFFFPPLRSSGFSFTC